MQGELAKKYSYFVLIIILSGLLIVGIMNLFKIFGPRTITASATPFGVPPGTVISLGTKKEENYDFSPTTVQELGRARDLLRYGKWRQAAETYHVLQLQHPQHSIFITGQIIALLDGDSLTSADKNRLESLINQLKQHGENTAEMLTVQGISALKNSQEIIAIEILEQALELTATLHDARINLISALLKRGQNLSALNAARTGISLTQGNDPRFYTALAQAWHNEGILDSCALVVEYALSKFPGEAPLAVLQGYLHEYNGAFDQAERIYKRLLALNPDDTLGTNALRSLGEKSPPGTGVSTVKLTPRNRIQPAIDILAPMVENYPDNMPLRYALGQVYLRAREFDLARLQFEKIMLEDPDYPEISQRIQEASATHRTSRRSLQLGANLKRDVDQLRAKNKALDQRAFSEKLGHYLVRWGASPKTFFQRYPLSKFTRIDSLKWRESYWEGTAKHQYTSVFTKQHGLTQVHVLVKDTSDMLKRPNVLYDFFGLYLEQNSRISGQGIATGETECGNIRFQGAVWETSDNFEIMVEFQGKKGEIQMLRLNRNAYETMPRLCEVVEIMLRF